MKKFNKFFTILIFCFLCNNLWWAQKTKGYLSVNGTINTVDGDSLTFSHGFLDTKFYEKPTLISIVKKGSFPLKLPTPSYPQLYALTATSQKDFLFIKGDFFIDKTTANIDIDINGRKENIDGKTYQEYKNKFLPFFINNKENIMTASIDGLLYEDKDFNQKLLKYIEETPHSFVALWALILGVNKNGNISAYEKAIHSFSTDVKKSRLWKIFNIHFNKIRIKDHHLFPKLSLKNQQLKEETLVIPKTKYVLVDYWFSTCKPCLEAFPKLKEIYTKYHQSGFDIVGISVDQTKRISNWNKRIDDFSLPWKQYLDENGKEASQDNITSFPHNFLLENGKVINRKLSLEELEVFLEMNLKK
ncbi:TlpA family protein disulfide reductase [Elizabethkingia meningoseptica]|uniref:TlpA family protein disulfide reductase n=1 Tax=Elizabethkingia meningoseptica TaxID=238 RepID=UPI0038920BA1